MYRYNWSPIELPSKLSYQQLIEKYKFYKYIQKWNLEPVNNELLDKIQDLRDEIVYRDTGVAN